jgi:hypothetical protein
MKPAVPCADAHPHPRQNLKRLLRTGLHLGLSLVSVILVVAYMLRSSARLRGRARLYASHTSGILVQGPIPSAALVTLASPSFLNCTIQLVRSARSHGWQEPIFVLAVNGTLFDNRLLKSLDALGVQVIHTAPALDDWVVKSVPRLFQFRRLEVIKFRKMEIFFNPLFRTFGRVIYMDPDGIIGAPLMPLALMSFPPAASVLLRQNDAAVGKLPLWESELAPEALRPSDRSKLQSRYPNRGKVGATSWFAADMKRIPPPSELLQQSRFILELYKPAFRLNDQTLVNMLFYNHMGLIPWCAWDEVRVIGDSNALRLYCENHMADQRYLNGRLTFMYRHMSPAEKAQCVSTGDKLRNRWRSKKLL